MIARLVLPCAALSAFPGFAAGQLHDWRFQVRLQVHGTHDPVLGDRAFVRRARIWGDDYFLPKASTRFQYDFKTKTVMDLWGSYHPTDHFEIRMGRSGGCGRGREGLHPVVGD